MQPRLIGHSCQKALLLPGTFNFLPVSTASVKLIPGVCPFCPDKIQQNIKIASIPSHIRQHLASLLALRVVNVLFLPRKLKAVFTMKRNEKKSVGCEITRWLINAFTHEQLHSRLIVSFHLDPACWVRCPLTNVPTLGLQHVLGALQLTLVCSDCHTVCCNHSSPIYRQATALMSIYWNSSNRFH